MPKDGTLHADQAPKALTYTMTKSVSMTQNLVTGPERDGMPVWLVDSREANATHTNQTQSDCSGFLLRHLELSLLLRCHLLPRSRDGTAMMKPWTMLDSSVRSGLRE